MALNCLGRFFALSDYQLHKTKKFEQLLFHVSNLLGYFSLTRYYFYHHFFEVLLLWTIQFQSRPPSPHPTMFSKFIRDCRSASAVQPTLSTHSKIRLMGFSDGQTSNNLHHAPIYVKEKKRGLNRLLSLHKLYERRAWNYVACKSCSGKMIRLEPSTCSGAWSREMHSDSKPLKKS